ncbi:hypothetical protein TSOC_003651 [Tetrabaena socialis]|uniref:Uncharacterized protein n=1 Tax=Tetrabaena socialis TaxID=47790 RepID=A0A2J8AAZ3_9CHLO|nr:hypothetical protein TSOC_003651 [Tetrabaena socialis]|eukprot:PNH09677.1 hypothetical protein TSOC_003651 [Tetrabaena socialis]
MRRRPFDLWRPGTVRGGRTRYPRVPAALSPLPPAPAAAPARESPRCCCCGCCCGSSAKDASDVPLAEGRRRSAELPSRALVASSSSSTRGRRTSARAMAMRCFWPPLSATPFSPQLVS